MGKAQSKRSVDITTDVKKGTEEEVTEKLEKIEDVDQKQVNGDASTKELNEAEKKDSSETENDKDLTTEKNAAINEKNTEENTGAGGDTPKEGENKETGAGVSEEITPLADESIKKSKKEKVKKKWSFRSISFGKKDKQKPSKNEEQNENAAALVNGDTEKVEGEADDNAKAEKPTEEGSIKPAAIEICENGQASEKELNGQDSSSTPTEEENKTANETITATDVAVATTISSVIENGTENDNNQTESKGNDELKSSEMPEVTQKPDSDKNGINVIAATIDTQGAVDKMIGVNVEEAVVANNKANPSELNDGHTTEEKAYQNGTKGDEVDLDGDVEPIKSQIEVIIENKNIAETELNTSNTKTTTYTTNTTHTITTTLPESTININNIESTEIKIENENQCEKTVEIEINNSKFSNIENRSSLNMQNDLELENESPMQEPPPLPVSPPPSKMSVFAFNNDNLESIPQVVEIPTPPSPYVLTESKVDMSEKIDDYVEKYIGANTDIECKAPNDSTETFDTEQHLKTTTKETDIVVTEIFTENETEAESQSQQVIEQSYVKEKDINGSQTEIKIQLESVPVVHDSVTAVEVASDPIPALMPEYGATHPFKLTSELEVEQSEQQSDEDKGGSNLNSIGESMIESLKKMEEVKELCEKLIIETMETEGKDSLQTDCSADNNQDNMVPIQKEIESENQPKSQFNLPLGGEDASQQTDMEKNELFCSDKESPTIAPVIDINITCEQNGNEENITTVNDTISTLNILNDSSNIKCHIENDNANNTTDDCTSAITIQFDNLNLNELPREIEHHNEEYR